MAVPDQGGAASEPAPLDAVPKVAEAGLPSYIAAVVSLKASGLREGLGLQGASHYVCIYVPPPAGTSTRLTYPRPTQPLQQMAISISIYDFPEELLEHVIALCVAASPIPSPATSPSWHTRTFLTKRTSPLLVSKAFNRIGTPLMYHSINITNPTQAELLLRTLRENPSISPLIRCLVLSSITIYSAQALSLCSNLALLDFALDAGSQPSPPPSTPGSRDPAPEPDVVEFSKALSNITQLRHLVVRKSSAGVYLTTPRVKHMLCHLAEALPHWDELVSSYDIVRLYP